MLNGIYLIVTGGQAVEGVFKLESWMAKRHKRTSLTPGVSTFIANGRATEFNPNWMTKIRAQVASCQVLPRYVHRL